MKITPGFWKTRDGRNAFVAVTVAPGKYPVVGYIMHPDGITPQKWISNGRWLHSNDEHHFDLIAPWSEETGELAAPEGKFVTAEAIRKAVLQISHESICDTEHMAERIIEHLGLSKEPTPEAKTVTVTAEKLQDLFNQITLSHTPNETSVRLIKELGLAPREKVKVSGFVNVYSLYPDPVRSVYITRESADKGAGSDRIACVYVEGVEE